MAKEFIVGAAQVLTMDASLEIGDVQQVVEVSADAVQIQTEAAVRATNITTNRLTNYRWRRGIPTCSPSLRQG